MNQQDIDAAAERVACVMRGNDPCVVYDQPRKPRASMDYSLDCRDLAELDLKSRQWQDEPDEEGWYWVEGYDKPRHIERYGGDGEWVERTDRMGVFQWDGRKVCRITKPPEKNR